MQEQSKKGLILCISGPSGVGKGTVIERLLEDYPDYYLSISMTTRAPRGAEVNGREYFFCTKEVFERQLEDGEILEYDTYLGHFYGTPAKPLREASARGQNSVLDITVAGAYRVKELFPDAITVFLLPPSFEVLRGRLSGRGTEADSLVEQRILQAKAEILEAKHFDYVVINDTIKDTVHKLEAILEAESLRSSRQPGLEQSIC